MKLLNFIDTERAIQFVQTQIDLIKKTWADFEPNRYYTKVQVDKLLESPVTSVTPVNFGGTGLNELLKDAVVLGNGSQPVQVLLGAAGPASITLNVVQVTLQYKDWAGFNQSQVVVTSVAISPNQFVKGVKTI